MTDGLIPHKAVLARLKLSRTSVWRAMRSCGDRFPQPVILRTRMHWREADVTAIARAMDAYGGRGAFEAARRDGGMAIRPRPPATGPRKPRAPRRKKPAVPETDLRQLDLFEGG